MTDFIIRQYNSSDYEHCRKLWIELTQHHRDIYEDPSIGGDTPEDYFDDHLNKVGPERLWVAESENEVIGLIGLIVEKTEAEVEPIIVSSNYRGKGIGEALIKHVIEEAKKLGSKFLSVRPVSRNYNAIRFFYRSGFNFLGELGLFIDLKPSEGRVWKAGPEVFGISFKY